MHFDGAYLLFYFERKVRKTETDNRSDILDKFRQLFRIASKQIFFPRDSRPGLFLGINCKVCQPSIKNETARSPTLFIDSLTHAHCVHHDP